MEYDQLAKLNFIGIRLPRKKLELNFYNHRMKLNEKSRMMKSFIMDILTEDLIKEKDLILLFGYNYMEIISGNAVFKQKIISTIPDKEFIAEELDRRKNFENNEERMIFKILFEKIY